MQYVSTHGNGAAPPVDGWGSADIARTGTTPSSNLRAWGGIASAVGPASLLRLATAALERHVQTTKARLPETRATAIEVARTTARRRTATRRAELLAELGALDAQEEADVLVVTTAVDDAARAVSQTLVESIEEALGAIAVAKRER